jgi:hypothetical protein
MTSQPDRSGEESGERENWGSDLVTGSLSAPYDGRGTIVPG